VPQVRLHLLDGFDNDRVECRVSGEVIGESGVTTSPLYGGALEGRPLVATVPEGTVQLEVRVPTRMLSERIELETQDDVDLLASIQDERLTVEQNISPTPPGFG
jgi:hypothetical protein